MLKRGPYTLIHDMQIFNLYSVEELSEVSPYSVNYIANLRSRPERITRLFRAHMAAVLERPEEELFGTSGWARVGTCPDSS